MVVTDICDFSTNDHILDLNQARFLFFRPLDDHAGRIALISILELVTHVLWTTQIEFGPNTWAIRNIRIDRGIAQHWDKLLVPCHLILIENSNYNRAKGWLS